MLRSTRATGFQLAMIVDAKPWCWLVFRHKQGTRSLQLSCTYEPDEVRGNTARIAYLEREIEGSVFVWISWVGSAQTQRRCRREGRTTHVGGAAGVGQIQCPINTYYLNDSTYPTRYFVFSKQGRCF